MSAVKFIAILAGLGAFAGSPSQAAEPTADPWAPVRRLIGTWEGVSSGQAGDGTVTREYRLVMNDRYIHEINISRYPPQAKNKAGEVHEHQGFISYDKSLKRLKMRQFHVEGFVNTYRQADPAPEGGPLVFDSESFENFNNSWKARESYDFLSSDEFVEIFELAPPGKPFETYSTTRLKRRK